jgi:hypothetical protein
MPTRVSVFSDPQVVEKVPYIMPSAETFAELESSRPAIPEWPEIQEIVGVWLSKAAIGEISAGEALNKSADETERILEEAGYYNLSLAERRRIARESQLIFD